LVDVKVSFQADCCCGKQECVELTSASTFAASTDGCGRVQLDWRLVVAYLTCGLVALLAL
jgi:hypothetical protein